LDAAGLHLIVFISSTEKSLDALAFSFCPNWRFATSQPPL
jgi:hypothetical protein